MPTNDPTAPRVVGGGAQPCPKCEHPRAVHSSMGCLAARADRTACECLKTQAEIMSAAVLPEEGTTPPKSLTPNKDRIRAVVEDALAQQYDGPGGAQRFWMVATIMQGLAELLPRPEQTQVALLAASLAESGNAELEEEWPK